MIQDAIGPKTIEGENNANEKAASSLKVSSSHVFPKLPSQIVIPIPSMPTLPTLPPTLPFFFRFNNNPNDQQREKPVSHPNNNIPDGTTLGIQLWQQQQQMQMRKEMLELMKQERDDRTKQKCSVM